MCQTDVWSSSFDFFFVDRSLEVNVNKVNVNKVIVKVNVNKVNDKVNDIYDVDLDKRSTKKKSKLELRTSV